MYQFTTQYPLAKSKQYFDTIKEAAKHLRKCIQATNAFRKLALQEELQPIDIANGLKLFRVNFNENPDAMKLLGPPSDICTKNLEKIDKEDNSQPWENDCKNTRKPYAAKKKE